MTHKLHYCLPASHQLKCWDLQASSSRMVLNFSIVSMNWNSGLLDKCRLGKTVTHWHSYNKDGVTHTRQLRQGNDHASQIGQCPGYIHHSTVNEFTISHPTSIKVIQDRLGFWDPDNRLRIPYQWNLSSKSHSSSGILYSQSWITDSTSPGFRILQAKFLGYTLNTWDVTHASPGSFG